LEKKRQKQTVTSASENMNKTLLYLLDEITAHGLTPHKAEFTSEPQEI